MNDTIKSESAVSRNYMVDLLRIIAILFVITHHFLGHGGVLENVGFFTFNWYFTWFIKTICYTSVTCFFLISSYYQSERPLGLRGIAKTWIIVEFYSIICFVFSVAVGIKAFSPIGMIKAFMPLTFRQYGFINGYILLAILVPFLNKAIFAFGKNTHKLLIIICTVLCSVLPYVSFIDPFNMDYGEGVLWIVLLYLIASYIRRYSCGQGKEWKYLVVFFSTSIVTYLTKVIIAYVTYSLFGEARYSGAFIGETQILMLISSVSLFLFFLRSGEKNNSKIIVFLSKLSKYVFAVFLIHENNNIKYHLWNCLNPGKIANSSLIKLVGFWGSIVIGLFVIGIIVELIRVLLFKLFHIDNIILFFLNKLKKIEQMIIR